MTPREYFTKFYEAAKRTEKLLGVPALFSLAQSAVETGWGKYAPGNNYFGIKADLSWKGPYTVKRTREVIKGKDVYIEARFRAYRTPDDSFLDQGHFLRRWSRYASAFLTKDPREFARRIASSGYATDPRYAITLISVIDLLEPMVPPTPPEKPMGMLARIFSWFRRGT